MPLDTGTNEWYGDEGEECDNHEPDYDSINDEMWLRKKEEEEKEQDVEPNDEYDEHDCCRGDCK